MSHDQNFKNLILDYPRQALAFFAEVEVAGIGEDARIIPIRQEQLKDRLGDRFRELDVPLLVEWPDGRREALLFVLEEESDPRRELALGGDRHTYLQFSYLACHLSEIPFELYRDSDNIVARLNLPNMRYGPEKRVEVFAHAVRGLSRLEPDPDKQIKYLEFIDIYSGLDDNERARYEVEYPEEAKTMSTFAERFIEQGCKKGEARILIRLLKQKFGDLPPAIVQRIESADQETLLEWSERVLKARRLEDVVR